jgi:hypothetical protein
MVQSVADSTVAAALTTGAVAWPQTSVSSAGPATLGNGSNPVSLAALTVLSAGRVVVSGSLTVGALTVSGGQFRAGDVAVSNSMSWTGGTMTGTGTTTLGSSATGTIAPTVGAQAIVLDGRALSSHGNLTFDCSQATDPTGTYGLIQGSNNAEIDNNATAAFQGDLSGAGSQGCEFQQADASVDVFRNYGTLQLTAYDTQLGWQFGNADTAVVSTSVGGTLDLYGGEAGGQPLGGVWEGQWGFLSLDAGGAYTFTADSVLTDGWGIAVQAPPSTPDWYGVGYLQFVEWIAGSATAPSLSAGAVSWPQASIYGYGPISIGDGSGIAQLAFLSEYGTPSNSSEAVINEPATMQVELKWGLNALEGATITLNGQVYSPHGDMVVSGTIREQGDSTFGGLYTGGSPGELIGAGTTTLTGYSDLSSNPFVLDGRKLVNQGTLVLEGITIGANGAEIDNQAKLLECCWSAGAEVLAAPGADAPVLVNESQMAQYTQGPYPPAYVSWKLENAGMIDSRGFVFGGETSGYTQQSATTSWSSMYGGRNVAAPYRPVPTCGDPVVCATGDQTEQQTDLTLGGRVRLMLVCGSTGPILRRRCRMRMGA